MCPALNQAACFFFRLAGWHVGLWHFFGVDATSESGSPIICSIKALHVYASLPRTIVSTHNTSRKAFSVVLNSSIPKELACQHEPFRKLIV